MSAEFAEYAHVAGQLREVRQRMAAAVLAAGRPADSVGLIAVSKFHPVEAVCAAYDAGQRDFGENLVQEMVPKAAAVAATGRRPRWHFVGHLQRNKVAAVVSTASMVHSIDRADLADAVAKRMGVRPVDVLIQVNSGREAQKSGVDPADLMALARHLEQLAPSGLRLCGLMTVPPADANPEPYFRDLAASLATLQQEACGRAAHTLSMGMSHDYEAAIRCGATLVRVGTAIFGQRKRKEDNP